MPDDEPKSRAPRAAAKARSVGHRSSGGHSPLIARPHHRFERDPNTVPDHARKAHPMTYKPYPKWLHFDGEPSVLVEDEAEHEAVMAARGAPEPVAGDELAPGSEDAFAGSQEHAPVAAPKRKGGRPKKDAAPIADPDFKASDPEFSVTNGDAE